MAGPTPRSALTGDDSGSDGAFWTAACFMLASLPGPSDTPPPSGEISNGTGTSAPSSRTSVAIAFFRPASSAASNPATAAASFSTGASGALTRACSTTVATRASSPFSRATPARVANRSGCSSGESASDSPSFTALLRLDLVGLEQHFVDLVLALAAGGADGDRVAHFAADQPARDRADDADASLLQVGLVLADDGVLRL